MLLLLCDSVVCELKTCVHKKCCEVDMHFTFSGVSDKGLLLSLGPYVESPTR